MGLRGRLAGFAGVGVLLVAPILVGQQPAGAAVKHSEATGSITFGDTNSFNVECGFGVTANFDNTAKTFTAGASLSGSGARADECFDVDLELIVDYRDSHGNAQHFDAAFFSSGTVTAKDVASNPKATLIVKYTDCDVNTNATCKGSIVTAPK